MPCVYSFNSSGRGYPQRSSRTWLEEMHCVAPTVVFPPSQIYTQSSLVHYDWTHWTGKKHALQTRGKSLSIIVQQTPLSMCFASCWYGLVSYSPDNIRVSSTISGIWWNMQEKLTSSRICSAQLIDGNRPVMNKSSGVRFWDSADHVYSSQWRPCNCIAFRGQHCPDKTYGWKWIQTVILNELWDISYLN